MRLSPGATAKPRPEHILKHEFREREYEEENGYPAAQAARPHQIKPQTGLHDDAATVAHGRRGGQLRIADCGL